jgi:hypothetical protein
MICLSGGTDGAVLTLLIIFPDKLHFRQVFPSYSSAQHPVTKDSALAKIQEKRAALKARNSGGGHS